MKTIKEPARELNVRAEVDVLVVGAGPAGLMAAEAAAKDKSLKVMLLEQRGYLGGNLTIGLPILAFLGPKGNQVVKGGAQRLIDRLWAKGAASEHKPCKNHMSLTIIDPDQTKTTAWEIMDDAGVEVLLYVFVVDTIVENGCVKGVIIESKAGREVILAKSVIDCTGDGDVAFRAGVECTKGDENGGMQPPTLMYLMKGVEMQKLRDAICNEPEKYDMDVMPPAQFRDGKFITVGLRGCIIEAQKQGYKVPVARTILITGLKDDEIWVNMTRVNGVDSTDPASYTHGEHEARRQMYEVTDYLKNFVPGFESAWIERSAAFMGIRESRVIVGKYVMTAQDILHQKSFDDVIAVAGYPVDIHHAEGGDCTMLFCDDAYDIPYGVLVPEHIEGLLVAGRCSSMDHEAMAATRVMSTCMALGEAAGTAARIAIADGVLPSGVDVKKVQAALLESGAYLGE
ncbi:MAG: FAD-dependent oxidoreductase [Alistipes sp.]|nr:FAD-dependent oxidoreductase [Alistipes sp.]